MRVGVLKGPAARPQPRACRRPIADGIQHLLVGKPIERLSELGCEACLADLHQRMASQRGVPHRRQAGLAVALLAVDDDQLAQCRLGGDAVRMIRRIAKAIEHHQRIGDRRKNAAKPIFAIEALGDEGDGLIDCPPPRLGREPRLGEPHQAVQ